MEAMTVHLRRPASTRPQIVDRAALDKALDRIASEHQGDRGVREAAVKAHLKQVLTEGRDLALKWLSEDSHSTDCVQKISFLMDEIISALHRYVTVHIHPGGPSPAPTERLAVIA